MTLVERYPVGWSVEAGKPAPVAAYLLDMPGVAMQGRDGGEALAKLRAVTPSVLKYLSQQGVVLPEPSAEPGMSIGSIEWLGHPRVLIS